MPMSGSTRSPTRLLGTIADGDIGSHFPPSDPRWKGADSATFLRHAAGVVAAQGGVVDHIDLTIICEAPKVGPHRERDARAESRKYLGPPGQVVISVKATTTERLGFTGRGEGMAAQAVVTVQGAARMKRRDASACRAVGRAGRAGRTTGLHPSRTTCAR